MTTDGNPVIGVLINQINGRYQSQLRSGIADYAHQSGIHFDYFVGKSLNSPYSGENEHNIVYTYAADTPLDGLIICTGAICSFLSHDDTAAFVKTFADKPIITIGLPVHGIPCITTDTGAKIKDLIHHLVSVHDYRRIAYLSGPHHNYDAEERKAAFIEALTQNGLSYDQSLLFDGDFSYTSGMAAAHRIGRCTHLPFDAIVCANDDMAFGFADTLKEYGFYAPKDYAITGIDDIPDASFYRPPLTTIHQQLYMQGYTAAQQVCAHFFPAGTSTPAATSGAHTATSGTVLPEQCSAELKIRSSCGCSATVKLLSRRIPSAAVTQNNETTIDLTPDDVLSSFSLSSFPPLYRSRITKLVPALFEQLCLDIRTFRGESLFIQTLNEWFDITAESWHNFSHIWETILMRMQTTILLHVTNVRLYAYIENLFTHALALLTYKMSTCNADYTHLVQNTMAAACEYSSQFAQIHDTETLYAVTKQLLTVFDIPYVVIIDKDNTSYTVKKNSLISHKSDTGTIIMPLVVPSKSPQLGFIHIPDLVQEPLIYELIRSLVSQGLQSIADYAPHIKKQHNVPSKETIESYADTVPLGIIETDRLMNIITMNKTAASYFSGTPAPHSLKAYMQPSLSAAESNVKNAIKAEKVTLPEIRIQVSGKNAAMMVLQIQHVSTGDVLESTECIRWFIIDALDVSADILFPDNSFFQEHSITAREKELIMYVMQGLRLRDIAQKLYIAESTVKGHLSHIYQKCDVSGSTELRALIQRCIPAATHTALYTYSLLMELLTVKNTETE